MAEILRTQKTADAIVVGGGPIGIHAANNLHERMGKKARIILATQEKEWGGQAGRSLEQFRIFNDSYAMAEIIDRSIKYYQQIEDDIKSTENSNLLEHFPYIFTVGDSKIPNNIRELLPDLDIHRANMAGYEKVRQNITDWGFDSGAHVMSADDLRDRFPEINGENIRSAMVVENAGKIKFDTFKSHIMNRNASSVNYRPGLRAEHIIMGKNGEAIGVDFGGERIYSDNIILALGAFVLNLDNLLPCPESKRLVSNFAVTHRELFFGKTPGKDATSYYLVSPDMAMVRSTPNEMYAHYGYAALDDIAIHSPVTDIHIDSRHIDEFDISHQDLFTARVYEMLGECSTKWSQLGANSWAIEPSGRSAGYYTAYRDDLPVIGKIDNTGVVLAAGADHSGVMGGRGMAEIAVDYLLGSKSMHDETYRQTDINRIPQKHEGLVL